MKIAIDITYSPSGGSLTQIVKMVEIFNQIDDLDIVIYSKKSNNKILSDLTIENKVILSKLANLSNFGRLIWGQFFLPFYLLNEKIDVLFCPGNFGPIFTPVKTIIWIHTIGPFFREFINHFLWISKGQNKAKLYINKFFMILSSYTASSIIFESQFTKQLFVNRFRVNENKSHVINIGFDKYFANNRKVNSKIIDDKINTNDKYILCVSHLYPYKNIIRLLKAYKQVLHIGKTTAKLLIAGNGGYRYYDREIEKAIVDLDIKSNVVLLGGVSRENLKELYLNAYLLVFPSPFENFPYTLVEAMSCGTPIVCSNTTAMPETCQNAALYFDPFNTKDIAEKINMMIENDLFRKEMSKKSITRAQELPDFNKVTFKTLEIMRELIKK